MKQTTEHNAISVRKVIPSLLSLILITAMVGAAELTSEREIIFPEAAAIALGALVAPDLAWRTDKFAILLTIALCAFFGIAIVLFLPIGLVWQLAIAYLVGQLVLLASRTTFAPLISAVVLPVLLQTRSLVYPLAAIVLTLLVLGTRMLLEKGRLRPKKPFRPSPLPDAEEITALIMRTLFAFLMFAAAVMSGYRYLACPPLLVAFTEFTRRGNQAMRAPLRTVVFLALAAAIGTLCRVTLCVLLPLPLTLAAATACVLLLLLVNWQKTYLPPAAAVTLLTMLIPEDVLLLYPPEVMLGAAIFVLAALIFFRSRTNPKRTI